MLLIRKTVVSGCERIVLSRHRVYKSTVNLTVQISPAAFNMSQALMIALLSADFQGC